MPASPEAGISGTIMRNFSIAVLSVLAGFAIITIVPIVMAVAGAIIGFAFMAVLLGTIIYAIKVAMDMDDEEKENGSQGNVDHSSE